MKKRLRIRSLILDRLRHFHDDKTGHIHVGNRSYQSYEDFAETTSRNQRAESTSSLEEFRQASTETAQLRQDSAPSESGRASAQPVDPPADSRPVTPRENQSQSQTLSHSVRDSFAGNPSASESHPSERFQVPRIFAQTQRGADVAVPSGRTEIVVNKPLQTSVQEADGNFSIVGQNRPTAHESAALSSRAKEAPSAPISADNLNPSTITPQALVTSFGADVPAQSSKLSGSPESFLTPNFSTNSTTNPKPAATNASYALKLATPTAFSSQTMSEASALFSSNKVLAPFPGILPVANPLPQQAKVLPLVLGTWLNGFPMSRGAESSLLFAIEKKLLRLGDILFGRYVTLPSKMGDKGLLDPSVMAQLGLLWMLWKKKHLRLRSEKTKFRSESDRAEGKDEAQQDENSEHGREAPQSTEICST